MCLAAPPPRRSMLKAPAPLRPQWHEGSTTGAQTVKGRGGGAARHIQRQMAWRRGRQAHSASNGLEEGPPGTFSVKWLGGGAARHIQRQMAWRRGRRHVQRQMAWRRGRQTRSASNGLEEGPPDTFSVKWLGGGAARHIQRQMAWRRGRQAHSASNGLEEGPPGTFSVKWLGGGAARHIQR